MHQPATILLMNKVPNISLKKFNSFGIDAYAQQILLLQSETSLSQFLEQVNDFGRVLMLGAGSNILFVNDFPGVVIVNKLNGKQIISEDADKVTIKAAAGENWHEFVRWTLVNGYFGLENLSLIPGTVGAAPIQNVGAYGVELDQYFDSLEAIDLGNGKNIIFNKADCQFGYRNSIFKTQLDRYLIKSVTLTLSKNLKPTLNYAGIKEKLLDSGVDVANLTGLQISDAICAIRNSKLPLPEKIGNAGSFFKNPTVSDEICALLASRYPNMPMYKISQTQFKIPAAWLIEQGGWKGFREGKVGVYDNHALILVNYGGGTGRQLWQLANNIKTSIKEKFGIELEPEPRIIHES